MPQIKIIVTDHTGTKKTPVELPDDIPMKRLVPALVTKLGLPVTSAGAPVVYKLDLKRTGQRLGDEDTLRSANVQADDIMRLLPEVTAGSATNIRLRRLQADYDRLRDLIASSEFIRIIETEGDPPEKYLIEFTCKGVASIDTSGKPTISEYHRVGVYLHASYPKEMPHMKWMTPIFHPNIHATNGSVCIDIWYASKSLDELIFMLGRMVQYDPDVTNPKSPLNYDAADWAKSHTRLFPIDSRPLRSADVLGSIKIGGSSSVSNDLLGSIRIGGDSTGGDDFIINIG